MGEGKRVFFFTHIILKKEFFDKDRIYLNDDRNEHSLGSSAKYLYKGGKYIPGNFWGKDQKKWG